MAHQHIRGDSVPYKFWVKTTIQRKNRAGKKQMTDMPFDSNLVQKKQQLWECWKQNVQDNTDIIHMRKREPSYCNNWQLDNTWIKNTTWQTDDIRSQLPSTLLFTNLTHDFTAVIFSAKLGIICENHLSIKAVILHCHYSSTHRVTDRAEFNAPPDTV